MRKIINKIYKLKRIYKDWLYDRRSKKRFKNHVYYTILIKKTDYENKSRLPKH